MWHAICKVPAMRCFVDDPGRRGEGLHLAVLTPTAIGVDCLNLAQPRSNPFHAESHRFVAEHPAWRFDTLVEPAGAPVAIDPLRLCETGPPGTAYRTSSRAFQPVACASFATVLFFLKPSTPAKRR
jgi:hypothetical protein